MISVKDNRFRIENDLFLRELLLDEGGLRTVSVLNKKNGREYEKRPDATDFQVALNARTITSFNKPDIHILDGNKVEYKKSLVFSDYQIIRENSGSEILELCFLCPQVDARIKLYFQIYPDLPGCIKWMKFECLKGELHISRLFFEMLNTCPGQFADAEFYKKQGTVLASPNFAACGDEDIIQLHNFKLDEGMFVGNSAPGPLRYYMVYPHWASGISCGYSMSSAYFNKYLKANESFTTDKAYIYLYEGAKDDPANLNGFRELVRRSLPVCPDNGGVMYCTWLPFLKNINEELLLGLVNHAAALGFSWFVVDDGWFTDGNWQVDLEKFPNGLEIISEHVRANGMKFGLWFNIGNDYGAIGTRPEDNALTSDGASKNWGAKITCRCLASKHRDFLVEKLSQLAKQYNVDYFKLDFSSILSPYGGIPYGCSATTHEYHRDLSDSVLEQYASMMHCRNELKKRFPNLVIDFSFETFGMETPSMGALMFSELHHASNMNTLKPEILNARKIRNTLYNYTTVLPNERILGSLICLQNNRDVEHLLTAFIGTPLVAGDLRLLGEDTKAEIKNICLNLNKLIAQGVLGEFHNFKGGKYIRYDEWDGFARYARNGQGIICLFRNEDACETVEITIPNLPEGCYALKDMANNEHIATCDARKLASGVAVKWQGKNYRALAFSRK
ncbi:MAG TPA: alpha-galactosidase [Lentisphaeria bacterium]|nr:alpha-galactosidase [Lentisphaeria bacterium]